MKQIMSRKKSKPALYLCTHDAREHMEPSHILIYFDKLVVKDNTNWDIIVLQSRVWHLCYLSDGSYNNNGNGYLWSGSPNDNNNAFALKSNDTKGKLNNYNRNNQFPARSLRAPCQSIVAGFLYKNTLITISYIIYYGFKFPSLWYLPSILWCS